jgi:hypothetical protein
MTDNLPTNWQDVMAGEARALARSFRPSTTQISTKSGIMSYMGQAVPGNKMDVIVLATIFENNFFEGKFDPRNPKNPICFAFGKPEANGNKPEMVPHPDISQENRQDATCDRCQWSKWASDTESVSGKGKRCKELYKLGLIPVAGETDEMAVLRVPVTSRKNYEVYVNALAASTGRPTWGAVTEISVRPHVKNQFEIIFTPKAPLPEEMLAKIYPKISGAYEALMQPYEPNADPLASRPADDGKKRKY